MPRSIWSGAISFGLVNVPVKLVTAVSRKTVRFHELHAEDGARVQHRRVCSADGEEVPYDEIVKGYDLGGDRYVVVTQEELEGLDPKKTRTIDIQEFVSVDEIDPMLYDNAYYLVPDGAPAVKAYELLRRAMAESGRVAIGRVVIRTKEHLAAIRPAGEALTLETMLFGDEVVPQEDLDLPASDTEPAEREIAMARQLIDSLSTEFDAGRHRDEYRERVLELIEQKARGEEVVTAPEAEEPVAAPDLMAALEASIRAAKGEGAGAGSDGGGGEDHGEAAGDGTGDGAGRKARGKGGGRGRKGGEAKSKSRS
ncbi:MAG: Ku protein [Actinomycetota bacterium]|nr:Ku protein [Actinomycetota bacterium]